MATRRFRTTGGSEMDDLLPHCIVSWDMYAEDAAVRARVQASLKAVLKGRSWVRPMAQVPLYIVKISDPLERERLKDELVEIARANPRSVRLVVGPVTQGTYGGWLPKSMWGKIRKRTHLAEENQ